MRQLLKIRGQEKMSGTEQAQNKQTFLTVLGLLLLLVVSIQSWYIYEMKKQLDSIPN